MGKGEMGSPAPAQFLDSALCGLSLVAGYYRIAGEPAQSELALSNVIGCGRLSSLSWERDEAEGSTCSSRERQRRVAACGARRAGAAHRHANR
jgi:hypothetical protein